jgi:DNA-directed RNA polymerase specialized sigma24 family protein
MTKPFTPEMHVRLVAAIVALPDLQRTVLRLSSRDELSYEEIAARLAVTVEEVRDALKLALLAISEGVYGDEEDGSS